MDYKIQYLGYSRYVPGSFKTLDNINNNNDWI